MDIEVLPVIEAATADARFVQTKPQRANEVQPTAQSDAQAADGTRIVWDFRTNKNDIRERVCGHKATLSREPKHGITDPGIRQEENPPKNALTISDRATCAFLGSRVYCALFDNYNRKDSPMKTMKSFLQHWLFSCSAALVAVV